MNNKTYFYKWIIFALVLFTLPFFIFYITKPSIQSTSIQIIIYSVTVLLSSTLLTLLVKSGKLKNIIPVAIIAAIAFSLSIATFDFLLK
ncbi:hypothetical protein PEC311524_06280 [Pectobacterium carotovorum subsp. carotovorum]|nr:hypothetical protein PEC311524_06280 [Pectobacterium carotovorum subsp. carotovorum]